MGKQVYISFDVNELQTNIMNFICAWVKTNKTPVPQREIIEEMKENGVKDFTTVSALKSLTRKGYIRKSHMHSIRTSYTQVRSF